MQVKETEEITAVCNSCGAHGKYNWFHQPGEWLGEYPGKGGVILISGVAECLECGNLQQIEPKSELTGN